MSLPTKDVEPHITLTSGQRLARGFKEAAVAPFDITRGTAGLGLGLVKAGAGKLRRRGQEVSYEVHDAVADVADTVPALVTGARSRRLPRAVKTLALVGLLGAGAVAFRVVRRSTRPEPSPRPPSVDPQLQP